MKRITTVILFLLAGSTAFAQKARTITGTITSNTTFYSDSIYTLDGFVYVKNNSTLTIQPGTIVKGKSGNRSTLIVTRGSKLVADGTAARPIIFTSDKNAGSRAGGDWGGIVLLGKATTNRPDCNTCPGATVAAGEAGGQTNIEGDLDNSSGDGLYGGTDDNDNSGVLRNIRIEFAGSLITTGNEINSLTLGGVGRGTVIENVQVSYGFDDSYEWFGGTVNAKRLISFGCGDDDFDTDFGYRGMVQYGLILRDSLEYDKGTGPTTNGFESDNDGGGTQALPHTAPVFSNITVIGPYSGNNTSFAFNSFQNGMRIRRNSSLSLFNSVIIGFRTGIFIDGSGSYNKYAGDSLILKNLVVAGHKDLALNAPSAVAFQTKFMNGMGNDTMTSSNGILVNPFNYSNPNFKAVSTGAAASGASFSGSKISDAFFDATSFRGAVGTGTDWTRCWSEFNPNTVNYSAGPYDIGSQSSPYYKGAIAAFAKDSGLTAKFTNGSVKADSYLWDFGVAGNSDTSTAVSPTYQYASAGTYTVTLIAYSQCGNDTAVQEYKATGIQKVTSILGYNLYPNPTAGNSTLTFALKTNENVTISLFDMTGRMVSEIADAKLTAGSHQFAVSTSALNSGSYFVKISTGTEAINLKFIVVK